MPELVATLALDEKTRRLWEVGVIADEMLARLCESAALVPTMARRRAPAQEAD